MKNPILELLQKNANYALFMRISVPLGIIGAASFLLWPAWAC